MNAETNSPLPAIPSILKDLNGGGSLLPGAENADQPIDVGLNRGVPVCQWRALKLRIDDPEITPDEVRQLANVRAEMLKWASIEGDAGTPEITDLGGTGKILVVVGHGDGGHRFAFDRLFNLDCSMASMVLINGETFKDNWRGRRKSDYIKYREVIAARRALAAGGDCASQLAPEEFEAIKRRLGVYRAAVLRGSDSIPTNDPWDVAVMCLVDIPRLLARLEVLEGEGLDRLPTPQVHLLGYGDTL
jgi:hypothetical protein